ncbi:outer membrane beta-barrel protein [Methylobacter sp. YRD-M1]|uniref:outer membrane beta-barrel protein n=1 Tax=Methylobacter sp. YRD-M1 TaxID=2911520 RepID=UPI00227D0D3B|nr:outer membrane beta-barrel protein [Methylobacter sp. YRD-M1]WAK04075.1 porin [Methylobacter sp. YRD-M1]
MSKSDLKFPVIDGRNQNCLVGAIVFLALFLSYPCASDAAGIQETKGLYEALTHEDLNDAPFLRDARLSVGGWVAADANFNPDHSEDRSNAPVSFKHRANEFNLEQLNLFVERQTLAGSDQWYIDGRFDFMLGLDAPYTQAAGHWDQHLISDKDLRYYKIAFPQAYAEVYAPIANGITAKVGHFYSIISYESVASPPNFFYSHSSTA